MEDPEEPKQEFVKESEEQEKANETGQFKRWLKFADIALGNEKEIAISADPEVKNPPKDPSAA